MHNSNNLRQLLEQGKIQEKLVTMSKNYIKYIKYPIYGFSLIGCVFGTAFALDINDKRNLSRTEMLLYPIGGTIGGATFGATWPFWIIGAPIFYFLGYESGSAIFKSLLVYGLLSDKNK